MVATHGLLCGHVDKIGRVREAWGAVRPSSHVHEKGHPLAALFYVPQNVWVTRSLGWGGVVYAMYSGTSS
jgi:hypothetical protein